MNVKTSISYSRLWDKMNSQISHVSENHMRSTYRNGVNISLSFPGEIYQNGPSLLQAIAKMDQFNFTHRPYALPAKIQKMSSFLRPEIPTIC